MNGNDGIDLIVYINSPTGVTVDLVTGIGSGGTAEGDFLENIEQIRGSNFDDRLIGNDNFNSLSGRDGNDTLEAGIGAGLFSGGNGNDLLIGNENQDTLEGQNGNDTIFGGDGNDFIVGDANDDVLNGGAGNDTINGGNGVDIITGASLVTLGVGEIDIIRGDSGADIIKLGTDSTSFYDDGLAGNGTDDYALIRRYNVTADTIELYSGNNYFLGASSVPGRGNGTAIYIDSDASGTLDTSVDELIGLLQGRRLNSGQITATTQGFTFI